MVKTFQNYVNENQPTHTVGSDFIIWGNPTKLHETKLNRTISFLKNTIDIPEPPANSEHRTITELELLENISNSLKESDMELIQKYDGKDFISAFMEILDQHNLDYDKNEIDNLIKDVETITLKEKYKFNRPRPTQLAERFGYELNTENYNKSKTASTPSYPSGHASQSRFLCTYLSEKYPKHKNKFSKLANEISMSRVKGLLHYPTDILAGELLGQHLYEQYRESINI